MNEMLCLVVPSVFATLVSDRRVDIELKNTSVCGTVFHNIT